MSHATVLVVLDSGRADYVREDSMPFLHGLAQRSISGSLDGPPGFAQRNVLYTGRYPDTSGTFGAFVFDPDHSPFRWVRRLGPLRGLVRPRKILYPTRVGIAQVTKWVTDTYHADPAWIPPKLLPFFRPSEAMRPIYEPGALAAKSIFDLCREGGLRFRFLAPPLSGNDEEVYATLVRELRWGAPYEFFVAHFNAPDEKGHSHGPFSAAMQGGFLQELDQKLATIHAALAAGYDSWNLLVLGDHGMAPVGRRVDVLHALKRASAKPAKDYVVFVNSTLAAFWYLTEKGEREVEAALSHLQGARLVDEDERARLRIPVDRRWGDRLLAAEPGVMFWPDYFHVKDSNVAGMHGYLDKSEESHGLMVLSSSSGSSPATSLRPRALVDVFPTLCELLGVGVPSGHEGRSLLSTADRPRASAPAVIPALAR